MSAPMIDDCGEAPLTAGQLPIDGACNPECKENDMEEDAENDSEMEEDEEQDEKSEMKNHEVTFDDLYEKLRDTIAAATMDPESHKQAMILFDAMDNLIDDHEPSCPLCGEGVMRMPWDGSACVAHECGS